MFIFGSIPLSQPIISSQSMYCGYTHIAELSSACVVKLNFPIYMHTYVSRMVEMCSVTPSYDDL